MLPFEDRYTRQRQLPEVGMVGQEQIARLRTQLPLTPSAQLAGLYLCRAGATVEWVEGATVADAFPHQEYFRWAGARELAEGSHLALTLIQRQLGLNSER